MNKRVLCIFSNYCYYYYYIFLLMYSLMFVIFCRPGLLSVGNSIRSLYKTDGLRGFYRGLTASYAGSLETALHFLIYEKMKLLTSNNLDNDIHPLKCMLIAAGTKTTASLICYPHGKFEKRIM